MLCARCHKNEATIHFTTVVDGKESDTTHLCKDCGPTSTGLHFLDPKKLEALSVSGRKCEFCGRPARSAATDTNGPVYWCFDCGMEFGRILVDLCISEQPGLIQRSKEANFFLSICGDPAVRAWSEAANRKAVQLLKERRRQDGRDTGS
jgi:hypothetical protein